MALIARLVVICSANSLKLEIAMKVSVHNMKISLLAGAVQGTLLAIFTFPAHADDAGDSGQKYLASNYEIGALNVSRSSAKFGEYTGLSKSAAELIGNFNILGGDAYRDSNGIKRWSISGSDLGTTSRTLVWTISNQGQWNFGIGYDELRHNISDTYQTPYVGSMGGNSFVLPAGFGLVSTAAAGVNPTGTDALSPPQYSALHTVDIATTRKNGSFNAGVNLNEQCDIKLDFNHLEQSGAKLMAFGSMGLGGASGEVVSMLPNPTNYKTDTLNIALNWMGDKGNLSTSYFGSYFRDGYNGVTFQTFVGANNMQTMSTPPSNDFHQLNLSGAYIFSPKTKLTGGLSYGRNTQNESYAADSISMVAAPPASSLNGFVRNTHADLKLIDQSRKNLVLAAGIKFDERNNKTASNFYYFNALDGSASHQAYFPNTPYSNRKTQLELSGDYRIDKNRTVRLAYNRENIKRWCDQYAVGGLGVLATGISTYPAGVNCVVATASSEDKLSATYRLKTSEDTNLSLGYSFSKRNTDSDPNAITARLGLNGNVNPSLAANTLIMGLNAGDYRGFYPFFDASRNQQMLKAGVNWQAGEKMSVGLSGKYTDDNYDSTYGVQKGNTWNMNLDAAYSYSERASVSIYLTRQYRERELTDLQRSPYLAGAAGTGTAIAIPSGAAWTDQLKDNQTTVGIGARQNGLMNSMLELSQDLTYSLGRTGYGTQLNYNTTTNIASGSLPCSDSHILSCGDLPVIRSEMWQFKVAGKYQLDQSSRIAMGYLFQKMKSDDYYYNGLQYGYTSNTMMPTNQQAPSYTMNVITISYVHNF
jgi:MtrB/PioB family decaheme-associated outer membrane protein